MAISGKPGESAAAQAEASRGTTSGGLAGSTRDGGFAGAGSSGGSGGLAGSTRDGGFAGAGSVGGSRGESTNRSLAGSTRDGGFGGAGVASLSRSAQAQRPTVSPGAGNVASGGVAGLKNATGFFSGAAKVADYNTIQKAIVASGSPLDAFGLNTLTPFGVKAFSFQKDLSTLQELQKLQDPTAEQKKQLSALQSQLTEQAKALKSEAAQLSGLPEEQAAFAAWQRSAFPSLRASTYGLDISPTGVGTAPGYDVIGPMTLGGYEGAYLGLSQKVPTMVQKDMPSYSVADFSQPSPSRTTYYDVDYARDVAEAFRQPSSLPAPSAAPSAALSAAPSGFLSGANKQALEYGRGTNVGTIGNVWSGMGVYNIPDMDIRTARMQSLLGQAMNLADIGAELRYQNAPNLKTSGYLDPTTAGLITHWTGSPKTTPQNLGLGSPLAGGYGYGALIDAQGNVTYTQPFNEAGLFPQTRHAYGLNQGNMGIASVGVVPNAAQLSSAQALGSEWFNPDVALTTHGYVAGTLANQRNLPGVNRRPLSEGAALAEAFSRGLAGFSPNPVASTAPVSPVAPVAPAAPVRVSLPNPAPEYYRSAFVPGNIVGRNPNEGIAATTVAAVPGNIVGRNPNEGIPATQVAMAPGNIVGRNPNEGVSAPSGPVQITNLPAPAGPVQITNLPAPAGPVQITNLPAARPSATTNFFSGLFTKYANNFSAGASPAEFASRGEGGNRSIKKRSDEEAIDKETIPPVTVPTGLDWDFQTASAPVSYTPPDVYSQYRALFAQPIPTSTGVGSLLPMIEVVPVNT